MDPIVMAPEKAKPVSVKLDEDVVDQARIVASYRKQSITDLLGEILRPALLKMEQDEVSKRNKLFHGPKSARGGKD